ncbi:MAG: PqqD family protein [Gammaproteobacteria bacterium]
MHVPTPRDNLLVREVEGETVVLNRADGHIHTLNHTASLIWHALDGKRSIEDIVRLLVEGFAVDHATAQTDVTEAINNLKNLNLLQIQKGSNNNEEP